MGYDDLLAVATVLWPSRDGASALLAYLLLNARICGAGICNGGSVSDNIKA